jgi:hypothetical protein
MYRILPQLVIFICATVVHAQQPNSETGKGGETAPDPSITQAAPGAWRAPSPMALQDYKTTRQQALAYEASKDVAKAMTAWERVIDRTNCTEEERMEARTHIRALRPKVAPVNKEKSKAQPWSVLVLLFRDVTFTWVTDKGVTNVAHKVFTENDIQKIHKSLKAFGEHVFKLSNGVAAMQIDIQLIEEPFKKIADKRSGYFMTPGDITPIVRERIKDKTYFTVIAYSKCNEGTGPDIPKPFTAAMYGRIAEFKNAGYMVVPWSTNYPYPGEADGEMETHEWLHQLYDVVQHNLGYPKEVMRSSDDGRNEGDTRATGEKEYRRPKGVTTWIHFYEHLMQEHITRQMWTEMTIDPKPADRPGDLFSK